MSLTRQCFGQDFVPGVLYEMVKQCLGSKSIKCVVEDNDCIFTCDMETLLSSLTMEHPVGELILQALKSHKEQYGEGVRTYMFMITRIAKAVSQLQDMGIRSGASLAVMQEVIDHLSRQVHQISIAVKLSSDNVLKDESVPALTGVEHTSKPVSCQRSLPVLIDEVTVTDTLLSGRVTVNPSSSGEVGEESLGSDSPSLRCVEELYSSCKMESVDYINPKLASPLDLDCVKSGRQKTSPESVHTDDRPQPYFKFGCSMTDRHGMSSSEQQPSENVTECDPVILKMSNVFHDEENDFDDIGWYFDENVRRGKDEKWELQDCDSSGKEETEWETVNNFESHDVTVSNGLTQTGQFVEERLLVTNHGDGNDGAKESKLSNLRDATQHDSDFEDCFDDLENRKQVVVVVERIEDVNGSNAILNFCQDKSPVMKSKLAHNVQKHFISAEFETVSVIPSLGNSQFDNDFSDSFEYGKCDQCEGETSSIADKPNFSKSLSRHVKQEQESKTNAVNLESGAHFRKTVINASTLKGSKYKQSSEVERLNSILSYVSTKKSHTVKEILISSRHNLEESDLHQSTNSNDDVKVDVNVEDRSSLMTQDETYLYKAQNNEADLNVFHEACQSCFDSVNITEREENAGNAGLETAANCTANIPLLLQSTHLKKLAKLDAVLSSMNLKTSYLKKKQILISSRHNLSDEEMRVKIPHDYSNSCNQEIVKDFSKIEVTPEDPMISSDSVSLDPFSGELSCKDAISDHRQLKDCHNEAKSITQIQEFNLANVAVKSTKSDLHIHVSPAIVGVHKAPKSVIEEEWLCHDQISYYTAEGLAPLNVRDMNNYPSLKGFHEDTFELKETNVNRQPKEETETDHHHRNECSQNRKSPQARPKAPCMLPEDLYTLARGHEGLMELLETLHCRSLGHEDNSGKKGLKLHLTNCVSIQSTKSEKVIVEGLVIPCQSHHLDNLRNSFGCQLNALLVNGDLTPSHRHKGYKPTIAKKNLIKSSADIGSQKKEVLWASGVVGKLKELHISVMLVRGTTTDVMLDVCISAGITLLTNIPYHALNIVSHQMKVDVLCYAEDAATSNVCDLCLEPLNPSWMDVTGKEHCLVLSNLNHVKSVVISEPCALAAQISEERFWKYFHRISNSLNDGDVLPGGGATELWCQEQILNVSSSPTEFQGSDQQLLRVTILETLAQVFHDFAYTVKQNVEKENVETVKLNPCQEQENTKCCTQDITHCSSSQRQTDSYGKVLKGHNQYLQASCFEVSEGKTIESGDFCGKSLAGSQGAHMRCADGIHHDTLSSKTSAWRSAVDVVSVLSSLDSLIITGASDKDLMADSVLL